MASVSKRHWKKPDGTVGEGWQVRYIDPATGKRPGKMFGLKKDADAFRKRVEREIEEGVHTADTSSKTVEVVAAEFLKHYEQRERDGSVGRTRIISIEQFSRKHIIPVIGGRRLSHLSFADIETLRDALVRKKLAPVSIKHIMGLAKQIEAFGLRRGYTKRAIIRDALGEAPARHRQTSRN